MPTSPRSAPPVAIAVIAPSLMPLEPQFATRWSAWQARGVHDAETQRRLRLVAPFLALLTAAAAYRLNR